jgi:hypothetical protein
MANMMNPFQAYTMSDIIQGAEHTVVIAISTGLAEIQQGSTALQRWGDRVWTVPEVILSKGNNVTVYEDVKPGVKPEVISKVRMAEIAWNKDAASTRQLLDHKNGVHLTHLELVTIAMKCLQNRRLVQKWKGDLTYALMGLLRIKPPIDITDSSLQAFARSVYMRTAMSPNVNTS